MRLEPKSKRCVSQRLSHPDSIRLIQNLKKCISENAYGRTKRLADILGCNARTAQRILNIEESKIPRLRKSYLRNAVKSTGIEPILLLGRVPVDSNIKRDMNFILDDSATLDRFQVFSRLAASMAARCMFSYDLPVSHTVDCDAKHAPFSIRIEARDKKLPSSPHVIAIVKDEELKWKLRYDHPKFGSRFKGALTDDNYERILQFIKSQPE
jgi:hypothetical protein